MPALPIGLMGGENLYQFALNVQRSNDPKNLAVFAIPLIAPELIVLSKAALVTLGIGIIYEKGKKALDTVMMAANGNQVDTGVANQIYEKINEYFQRTGKKPDKCEVLQELIDCGQISAKQAKSTQKAWGCRHSRHSKDRSNRKNNMANNRISSFDAFLECKDLSINDLLEKLLHSNTIIQYEAAKRLQFFQYKEIIDIIRNILLTSRYSEHREIANFILGQMQEKLSTTELKEIFSILIHSIQNDKSIKVKSSAISSLGHLFRKYNLGEEEFRTVENNISSIWNINRYSIIISISFSSAYFPKRDYIKEYLIKNLNSKHHKIISWVLYGLKGKHYKSESIENLLIHKLSQFNEKSYIYNEIIAFLISISSKKVIPYVKKTLFTQSKIDDEIYTELKNNLSDEFAELRKKLLEEFK